MRLLAFPCMRTVTVRFEDGALEDVDRVRGRVPREAWIRDLCAAAVVAADALGSSGLPPALSSRGEARAVEALRALPGVKRGSEVAPAQRPVRPVVRQPRPIVQKRKGRS